MKKMYSVLVRLSKALTIIFAAILIIASLTINNMSFDNPSFDIFASLMWASLVISPICGVAWFVFVIKERQEEEKQEQERRRIQRQSKPRGRQSSEDGKCVKNLSGYSKIEAIWPYNDSCIPFVCKEDDNYNQQNQPILRTFVFIPSVTLVDCPKTDRQNSIHLFCGLFDEFI